MPYLPKAPYVLTILRGLKELFMTCLELSKLRTTGTLSQATRAPRARLTACRTMRPWHGRGSRSASVPQAGPAPGRSRDHPPPSGRPPRPWPLSSPSGLTEAEGGAAGPPPGGLGRGPSPQPPFPPAKGHSETDVETTMTTVLVGWAWLSLAKNGPAPPGAAVLGPGIRPCVHACRGPPTVSKCGLDPPSFLLLHLQDLVLEAARPGGK